MTAVAFHGPILPDNAPFTPAQRAWLNGFFAGLLSPASAVDVPTEPKVSLAILFASQTGTAEGLSKKLAKTARSKGLDASTIDLGTLDLAAIGKLGRVAIIASTYGEGEPPDGAKALAETLAAADGKPLEGLEFAVLALGDRNYSTFCEFGVALDKMFEALGGMRLIPRVECDVDVDVPFATFSTALFEALQSAGGPIAATPVAVAMHDEDSAAQTEEEVWSRERPFRAPLLSNDVLNGPGSDKETRHIVLSLAGSGLAYEPGDALGILPSNAPEAVDAILAAVGLTGEEPITLASATLPLRDALLHRLAISKLAHASVIKFQERADSATLGNLLDPDNAGDLQAWLWGRELIDLVTEFPGVITDAEGLAGILPRLAPRLYSISSSQRAHPEEVHLTVAAVRFRSHGIDRVGVASTYVADRLGPGGEAPVYLHRNPRFRLPEDPSVPLIMIGPGTGIAPFRAFLEERRAVRAKGKAWLFVGDRREAHDYLYHSELRSFRHDGTLTRLDAAFSRDGPDKVYVQHVMLEAGAELSRWIADGACIYVCGDGSRMARDVDAALRTILATHGRISEAEARLELQSLAGERRYCRDVY